VAPPRKRLPPGLQRNGSVKEILGIRLEPRLVDGLDAAVLCGIAKTRTAAVALAVDTWLQANHEFITEAFHLMEQKRNIEAQLAALGERQQQLQLPPPPAPPPRPANDRIDRADEIERRRVLG
jgi:hypothetical protein